ncbi:hypothetical protein ANN_26104, partial [Periplaneta americana]
PELVRKYGYPVEEHTVQTEDGYLLTHFRIPHGRTNSTTRGRRPIILQHGLLGASDLWILMGREKSLGFILADAGFDVWLTNIRGNRHSHKHVRLSTNSAQFWNFSWHEMGVYDMPATIDHILATTGQKRLYYVGHSMGTTMFFVMTSMRPEYNDKLRLGIALAPVAFLWKPSHQLLQATIPARRQIAVGSHYSQVVTLIMATIYLLRIYKKYIYETSTILQCSNQYCLQRLASDVEVVVSM